LAALVTSEPVEVGADALEQGLVERPAGRHVAWATWGDSDGAPVLRVHGTPGSRLARNPDPQLFERAGARVATFDRPGYGASTAQRERTILSVADDALAVADALGWDRFAVLGVSGGGPHALAVAVRAPARVVGLGIAVGMTPQELVDDDQLIAFNREARRRALEEGRSGLERFLAGPAAQMADNPVEALTAAMVDAPPIDRELLGRPDVRAVLVESLQEAFRNGPSGWFDDSWALNSAWGFELEDVVVPAHLWYGAADRNVPVDAARAMAGLLPQASLEVIDGCGHLGWLVHEERILRTLSV
jgi:pimeloyl-ACP methyl ester carboxylesterase